MSYLGIDVGTGGTRALVIDEHGAVVASGVFGARAFASPQPGWAEQDPRDWWRAGGAAVRKALQTTGRTGADDIACVGFSGQMHGAVLLDAADEVVRPAHYLVRPAERGADRDELEEMFGRDTVDPADVQSSTDKFHSDEAVCGCARPSRRIGRGWRM